MKTTDTPTNSPLAGLVHSGQEAIHTLTDHVRATADKSRQLLNKRHRNDLLCELGQLHYDAHRTGNQPDQESVDRLIAQLESDNSDGTDHDEAANAPSEHSPADREDATT